MFQAENPPDSAESDIIDTSLFAFADPADNRQYQWLVKSCDFTHQCNWGTIGGADQTLKWRVVNKTKTAPPQLTDDELTDEAVDENEMLGNLM